MRTTLTMRSARHARENSAGNCAMIDESRKWRSRRSCATRGWYYAPSPMSGVRFPRAIVWYRLPMSVVFSRLGTRSFLDARVRYFLFIARLIARSVPYAILSSHPRIFRTSALRRFSRFRLGAAGSNCLHCTDPPDDISHYIKLRAELRVEG